MDLSERKLKILQAIIADFIRTAEPVGSRTISRNYDLGVSPATVRNEMSDLEELGYLSHPHTSSGRVPSEKAYRLYVNELMKKRELTSEEKDAIRIQTLRQCDGTGEFNEAGGTHSVRDHQSDGICINASQGRGYAQVYQSAACG